jgi:hypothetical protein
MKALSVSFRPDRRPARAARAVLLLATWLASAACGARAEDKEAPTAPPPSAIAGQPAPFPLDPLVPGEPGDVDGDLVPASCPACSGGVLAPYGYRPAPLPPLPPLSPVPVAPADGEAPCASCGAGCYPGRKGCYPCEANTCMGRFCCALYECICCTDPCYEPHWTPIADAAFFTDAARPQTQMRLRSDFAQDIQFPDRSEFFWARADGKGKGPSPTAPLLGEQKVNYSELSMYTEGATGRIGVFVEMPYRSIDPTVDPHASGFADMNTGTKTLLYDCELLQLTFQFRTWIPMGNFRKGLGTGHVSLEPSLILGLKLAPETFLQAQVAEWIPLGGDPDYQGSVLMTKWSVNQVVCRILPDVPLIATAEMNTWSFQDGAYTDPVLGPDQKSSGTTYVSMGPGLRLVICDKIDFGIGTLFSVTEHHLADQTYRLEFRARF